MPIGHGKKRTGRAGFAVVDCETTGLSPSRDRIIEIGVVLLDDSGGAEGEWSSLVNPGRPVSAQFIHGLSDDDVADAPSFAEILPTLVPLLRGRSIVAHNARFDIAFLNAAFDRSSYPLTFPLDAAVCTMELSKIYLPAGRHSLLEAAQRAGIRAHRHHRALVDAWTAAELLRAYLTAEENGVRYLPQAISRDGRVMLPAAWVDAQERAARIAWPDSLL